MGGEECFTRCSPLRCVGSKSRKQQAKASDESTLLAEIESERRRIAQLQEEEAKEKVEIAKGPVSIDQVHLFSDSQQHAQQEESDAEYSSNRSQPGMQQHDVPAAQPKPALRVSIAAGAEIPMQDEEEEEGDEDQQDAKLTLSSILRQGSNTSVLNGSVLKKARPTQMMIYTIALGFVLFILISTSIEIGNQSPVVVSDPSLASGASGHGASGSSGDHGIDDHGMGHGGDADHGDDGHGGHGDDDHGTVIGDGPATHGDDGHGDDGHGTTDNGHGHRNDGHEDRDHGHTDDGHGDDGHGATDDGHGDDGHGSGHDDNHDSHESGGTGHDDDSDHTDEDHHPRLLGGGASGSGASGGSAVEQPMPLAHTHKVPTILLHIAFSLTGCGLVAFFINVAKQPLILGYLLGGVLVGPMVLKIVPDHHAIAELSSLGLIFLLFLVGLELDPKEVKEVGSLGVVAGMFQFPICAIVHISIFTGLEMIGISWGEGAYAAMYVGLVCSISSTMIVVKALGEKGETSAGHGKLTIGILIFQDVWAIVVLAIQPRLDNPDPLGILVIFGMILILIAVAMAYAMFVMPAVLFYASKSVELMFVMSLAWCFFICCAALLPFMGLGPELASLIAGSALATFPYSAEFNGKIKFIRDFFITLFFAGLGMQIPAPSIVVILKALLVAGVVLMVRWMGIFTLVRIAGGSSKAKIGAMATINLSQISEFALVICTLGIGFGHIDNETMTIIIWTFAVLAVLASYMIGYNLDLYKILAKLVNQMMCKEIKADDGEEHGGHDGHGHDEDCDIVFLGYHRIAMMLVAEFNAKSPAHMKRFHVIDFNRENERALKEKGIQYSYGDISSADVLEHAHHGVPKIVISTIPDHVLQGTDNLKLLNVCKEVWPTAKYIVTADNPVQAGKLYEKGAHYVLRSAKLCAERLYNLLSHAQTKPSEMAQRLEHFKKKDNAGRQSVMGGTMSFGSHNLGGKM